jgi:hypothetical protein
MAYTKSIVTLIRVVSTRITDSCFRTSHFREGNPDSYEFVVKPVTSF